MKEFNVNIDERYENITDPQSFVRLIIVKALKNTTIASLANFDIGKLQKGLTETVRKTAEKALARLKASKAVEAGKKDLIEEKATETAKECSRKGLRYFKEIFTFRE